MRKGIVGVVVALIIGAAGYLGVAYWAQHAAAREVDAALDGWSAGIGSATRGRVDYDLWTRTLRVADVVVQSRSAPYPKITVGRIVASGIDVAGRAARIDIADLEVSDAPAGQSGAVMRQTAPKVILTDFSVRQLAPRKAETGLDRTRLWLERFSAVTAASIEVPSLTVTLTPAADAGQPLAPGAAEYTYADLALRGVREGRIAQATMQGVVLRIGVAGPFRGPAQEVRGEIGRSSITDADMRPLLAVLDPARPKDGTDGGYQRVYGQVSMGPYTLSLGHGANMRVERIVAEDVGLDPERLSLDDLLFLGEVTSMPGGAASPNQAIMVLDKVAGLYEGLRLGKLEVHGFDFSAIGDTARMASLRLGGLENGRLGVLAIDGLESKPAISDPFSFGRIAFKGLDVANLLRLMGELSVPGQQRAPGQLIGDLKLLEGVELNGIAVPDPKTRSIMRLDAFNAARGPFVGPLPSAAQLSLKLSVPIGAFDPQPFVYLLAGAGVSTLATEVQLGVHWSEEAKTVALEPASFEIGGVLALSLKGSAANVSPELFAAGVPAGLAGVAQVEAGPVEMTLRDLGLVDLAAGELARRAGQGPEAGRALLQEAWTAQAQSQTNLHPEAAPFFQAVAAFLQGKGETLTVRLTPKGRVGALELIEAAQQDPLGALLARFTVETTGGR